MPASTPTPMAVSTGDSATRPNDRRSRSRQRPPADAQGYRADATDKRNVERIRQTQLGVTVEHDSIAERRPEPFPEQVAQAQRLDHR